MDIQTRIGVGGTAVGVGVSLAQPLLGWLVAGPIIVTCVGVAAWGFWPLVVNRWPLPPWLRRAKVYETPVFKVVAHVANKIGDRDAKNCFPRACREIRQTALNGEMILWGYRSARKMGGGGGRSEVITAIPKEYWETADLSPTATDEAADDHFHTFPYRFSDGMFGEEIFVYAKLRANWNEVLRKWPS